MIKRFRATSATPGRMEGARDSALRTSEPWGGLNTRLAGTGLAQEHSEACRLLRGIATACFKRSFEVLPLVTELAATILVEMGTSGQSCTIGVGMTFQILKAASQTAILQPEIGSEKSDQRGKNDTFLFVHLLLRRCHRAWPTMRLVWHGKLL